MARGPLHSFKILEFEGLGTAPLAFCAKLLTGLGPEVLRIAKGATLVRFEVETWHQSRGRYWLDRLNCGVKKILRKESIEMRNVKSIWREGGGLILKGKMISASPLQHFPPTGAVGERNSLQL